MCAESQSLTQIMEQPSPSVPHPKHSKDVSDVSKKPENAKDHILMALDGSPSSTYALQWAKEHFLNAKKHVVYLLTVSKTNPKASMIYSAGIGKCSVFCTHFHL